LPAAVTGTVYVVVCMDTEGPCADPGAPDLLATWDAVDAAMDKLFDARFREGHRDSEGGSIRFGWFFLTWTGFTSNPRARAFGYHAVRDHYLSRWRDALEAYGDEQCWHYHQPPASGIGNEWGLDWSASREYERILSQQVLGRGWFPSCFRAGGTILSPESSRWVDSWFPIDYSNRAPLTLPGLVDWSEGVAEWRLYHPDAEDFRRPGSGRRRMARCLDLATGVHRIGEADVEAAFERAEDGKPAILACFDHDYRDIARRLDDFAALIGRVAVRHSGVPWRYAGPVEAVRGYLDVPRPQSLSLDAYVLDGEVHIRSSGPIHQSIPWLAVESGEEVVHVEEGVERLEPTRWRWQPPAGLAWRRLGVGASTDLGESSVIAIGPDDGPGALFLRMRTAADLAEPRSVWHHSKYHVELGIARASGDAEEMDAARQAVDLLATRLERGMNVLDVGCAAGYLERSLAPLGVEYFGIDTSERAVDVARAYGARRGVPAARFRVLPIERLPPGERYDAVVSLSTLLYLPAFQQPLEAMARATRRWLVVRASFGDRTLTRFLPDVLLEPGFESMRAYFNVYARDEVEAFLVTEGFSVAWVPDRRQDERFGGSAEVVGGVEIPYEFLLAERVAAVPGRDEVLDERLRSIADEWQRSRAR
jgi:SAM-dependent methyltransferase